MKKLLLFSFLLVVGISMSAQTIFSHDFEAGMDPMTVVDADGLNPHPNVAGLGEWTVANPSYGNGTNLAINTSWYSPVGAANDWMITPAIEITDASTVLSWEAKAVDPNYRDGYQVLVSTTDNELSSFNDVVFSVNAENATDELVPHTVSLADYVDQTIHIAFRNNSFDKFILLMDNISVRIVQPNDAGVTKVPGARFHELGTSVDVMATIENFGGEMLTSVDLTWSDGTNDYTDNITGLNLAPGESTEVTHSQAYMVGEAVTYDLTVYTSNPNGQEDGDTGNDVMNRSVSGVTFIPTKKVVGEEATGTWCGWCPRGTVALQEMEVNYPDEFIGIAVHNSDPMALAEYDSNMNVGGYPSSNVDRTILDDDPANFETNYLIQKDVIAPLTAEVTTSYDMDSRMLTVTASTEFVTKLDDIDYRFAVVLVEDHVTGTSAGYNQANYYSSQSQNIDLTGPDGVNWRNLPSTVPADQMIYDHVGRALLGGFFGVEESMPRAVVAGDVAAYTFETTIPPGWDATELHAVVLILDNETGAILNANKAEVASTSATNEIVDNDLVSIFPNPLTDNATITLSLDEASDITLEVVDMVGKTVSRVDYGTRNGNITLNYDAQQLQEGMYLMHLKVGDVVATKKVTVVK